MLKDYITISTQSNSADVDIDLENTEVPTHEHIRQSDRAKAKSLRKRIKKRIEMEMSKVVDLNDQDFKDEVAGPASKGSGVKRCVKNEGR